MDINLNNLIKIHEIQGISKNTNDREEYIKTYITDILNLSYITDDYGNIYVTKGLGRNGYKGIVSHIDTVHNIHEDRKVYQHDDILFAFGYVTTFNSKTYKQVGIGGDDSVGIFLCLQALSDFDDIKAVFYKDEEIGKIGSNASDISFLQDCNFVVEPDRKGDSDFITTSSGIKMCSIEFENTIKNILDRYGYSVAIGVSTDVDTLKKKGLDVCCFNISCGYFHPHSDGEFVSISCVQNCYDLLVELWLTHGNTRFEHKYVAPVYNFTTVSTYIKSKLGFLKKKYNNTDFVKDDELSDFRPITKYSCYYRYTGEYSINLLNVCPICNTKHTLRFLPNEGKVYCVGKCNNYIEPTDSILNSITYTDSRSKTEFRYLKSSDYWVKSDNSEYNTYMKSYIYKTPAYNYSNYDYNGYGY